MVFIYISAEKKICLNNLVKQFRQDVTERNANTDIDATQHETLNRRACVGIVTRLWKHGAGEGRRRCPVRGGVRRIMRLLTLN